MLKLRAFNSVTKQWRWLKANDIAGLRLLGPFTVNFDDPGIDGVGVLVTTLPVGAVVFEARVQVTPPWNGSGEEPDLQLALGGDGYASGDWFNFMAVPAQADTNQFGISGAIPFSNVRISESGFMTHAQGGTLSTPGAVVANCNDVDATQGQAIIYLLVHIPA